MKAKLFGIASITIESGCGIVLSYFCPDLLWLGYTLIGIGFISLIIGFNTKYTTKPVNWFKTRIRMVLLVIMHINDSARFLYIADKQKNSPEKWLYPVIKYIDLNRNGSEQNGDNVYAKFYVDSHLLTELKDYQLYMKLCLKNSTYNEFESCWYNVKQNLTPINALERHELGEEHFTLKEELAQKFLQSFRDGNYLIAKLKIGVKFKESDSPKYLEHSYWITPMNDYRGV